MIFKAMTKHTMIALSFAVTTTLVACGGGNQTPGEQADVLAEDAGAEVEAGTEAVADAASDVAADAAEGAEEGAAVVADAASDGWTVMQDDWQGSAGLVKDRWAELTEEEILATGGDREQLVSLVQDRYGIDREAAEMEVDVWASAL